MGANQGYKTGIFLRLGAKVVAVEPDAMSGQSSGRNSKYRLRRNPLVIVGKAISDRISFRTMWIDTPGSAKNTLSQKWAETLRHDDKRFGQPWLRPRKEVGTISVEQFLAHTGCPSSSRSTLRATS